MYKIHDTVAVVYRYDYDIGTISPRLSRVIDVARDAAWQPTSNLSDGARYVARRESYGRLTALLIPRAPRHTSPQLTALVASIGRFQRALRSASANVCGLPYYERKRLSRELRGCLAEFDRAR